MGIPDPNAPLLLCGDCEDGTRPCHACGTIGGFYRMRYPGGPSDWHPCDHCDGRGSRTCDTCDGRGEHPDPEATLRCECGVELNDDGSCDRGCFDDAEAA